MSTPEAGNNWGGDPRVMKPIPSPEVKCTCKAKLGTEHKAGCPMHVTVEPGRYRVGDGPWIQRKTNEARLADELTCAFRAVLLTQIVSPASPELLDRAYDQFRESLTNILRFISNKK